jgi:hypothetical protein
VSQEYHIPVEEPGEEEGKQKKIAAGEGMLEITVNLIGSPYFITTRYPHTRLTLDTHLPRSDSTT